MEWSKARREKHKRSDEDKYYNYKSKVALNIQVLPGSG